MVVGPPVATHAGHGNVQVKSTDTIVGTGEEATLYSTVAVHYTGWLADGTKFDSSLDRGKPFEFVLGAGRVIRGWDQGVLGMRVGGTRELVIPPELAYGKQGAGQGLIPPDATLKFQVKLVGIAPPPYTNIDNRALRDLIAKGVKVVDVRRPDEWKRTGVIEGSELITAFDRTGRFIQDFPTRFQAYAKSGEPVILICQLGNRSSVLANFVSRKIGYSKVYNVTDGIERWIKDGNAVVPAAK